MWLEKAKEQARDVLEHFEEEIRERLGKFGEINDKNYKFDEAVQRHADDYTGVDPDLKAAAEILTELADHEETDRGMVEGLDMKEAFMCVAGLTFGQCVRSLVRKTLRDLDTELGDYEDDKNDDESKEEFVKRRFAEILSDNLG